jgi:hypothetical protein
MVKMDPDAALAAMRNAVTHLRVPPKDQKHGFTVDEENEREYAWNNLGESFEALDGWLSKGGFLPSAWVPEMGRERKDTPMG